MRAVFGEEATLLRPKPLELENKLSARTQAVLFRRRYSVRQKVGSGTLGRAGLSSMMGLSRNHSRKSRHA